MLNNALDYCTITTTDAVIAVRNQIVRKIIHIENVTVSYQSCRKLSNSRIETLDVILTGEWEYYESRN